jgi:hypothetical protein
MKIESPKNQHALVVWLLLSHYTAGVTMVDAMNFYFHKFQTRLLELEVERAGKLKITRLPITKKNRFGHSCSFLRYKSNANKIYLRNLLKKLNRNGFFKK